MSVSPIDFQGNIERFIDLLLSQGGVMTLLREGVSETRLGIGHFRAIAARALSPKAQTWIWSSRVRLGVV